MRTRIRIMVEVKMTTTVSAQHTAKYLIPLPCSLKNHDENWCGLRRVAVL